MTEKLFEHPRRSHPPVPGMTPAAFGKGLHRLRLLFVEARPGVQAVFTVRFAAGALAGAAPAGRRWTALAAGAPAWVLLCCAVYVLNGWTDRVGDRLNGSRRPIASGMLPVDTALRSVIVLFCASFGLLTAAASRVLPAAAALAVLGAAYSLGRRPLKASAWGAPVAIAVGAALTFQAGMTCAECSPDARTWWLFGFCGWVAAAGCTKDLSDVVGDRTVGRRTWPVLLGARRAATAIGVVSLSGALALTAGAAVVGDGVLLRASLAVTVGSAALLTPRALGNQRNPRSAYRVYMATQYAVLLLMATPGGW